MAPIMDCGRADLPCDACTLTRGLVAVNGGEGGFAEKGASSVGRERGVGNLEKRGIPVFRMLGT